MREKLEEHARVVLLDVDSITPSPYQARKTFSEKEIKKLAVSILQNGLLQPISVRPTIDGRWQLIAGYGRPMGQLPRLMTAWTVSCTEI